MTSSSNLTICAAANFTLEPIEPMLAYWLTFLGIPAEIRFAPYNQVFQQLMEGGLLRANRGGVNLVGLDLCSWLVDGPIEEARVQLNKAVDDLLALLPTAAAQGCGGALLLFPVGEGVDAERAAAAITAQERIAADCAAGQGWRAVDLAKTAELYRVAKVRDAFSDKLGHIPFTDEMYAAAGTAVARWIRSTRVKPKKVIVLDCDNTLWQGVCGEGEVAVKEPHRKLHEMMLRQREEGVLLAIASKNNEDDVMAVLESEQSVLKAEHFTAWQINWQAKSENLKTLSEELGLALNSFLFVDDSPLECMEVRNACPEVLAVELPQEAAEIPGFLEHYWALDRPAATEEDRNRASMYQAERQRVDLSKKALTREEFLASLKIEIQMGPAAESDLARVAQLTQRTTQFNMSGTQHTVEGLRGLLEAGAGECWTVRVRDAFGDYGLVGVMVFARVEGALRADTFLLSCRALGRGVEDRMVEGLKQRAREQGIARVVIPFTPTARNRPAYEFLARICDAPPDAGGPFECVLSATGNASEWRASEAVVAVDTVTTPTMVEATVVSEAEALQRIAREVRSAAAAIRVLREQKKSRPEEAGTFVEAKAGAEATVAAIWSDCLALKPIGAEDNFFEMGGQSLTAARALARIHDEFGVEMGLAEIYARPTPKMMAVYIEEVTRNATGSKMAVSSRS